VLVGIEAEVLTGVVGKIPGVAAVADNEELHEAQQAVGVTVAGIVFMALPQMEWVDYRNPL